MENLKTPKLVLLIFTFLTLSFIIFTVTTFRCRNNFSKILNDIKSQTITYYKANKTTLNKYSNEFNNQKKIVYIRFDNENFDDKLIFYVRFLETQDKLYKFNLNSTIPFRFKNLNDLENDIEIHENNLIISRAEFESKYSIKINYFEYWIQILKTNDLVSISKGMWFNNAIVFSLNTSGKLVNKLDSNKLQNLTNEIEYLEEIDANWYFYFTKDTVGFF